MCPSCNGAYLAPGMTLPDHECDTKRTMSDLANDTAGPFSIGQDAVWPGLAKLAEEAGEVVQVIGKLIATAGRTDHWSGHDLGRDLEDEIADVQAACLFVLAKCAPLVDRERVVRRTVGKLCLFSKWHGDTEDQTTKMHDAYLYGQPMNGPAY